MLLKKISAPVLVSGVLTLSLFTGACATKKHVREAIAPVQNQVNDVSKKTEQNRTSIGDLDRNVAKVGESAMEADRKAGAAGESARMANQTATAAQQSANGATQLAQQSLTKAGQLETNINAINTSLNGLDNYRQAAAEKVYFRVNHSELTKEEKEKLDQALQTVTNAKNYAIEVAGFTDRTGNKAANLDLGRRRAEAVVRYLTIEKNIPLRKIHDVGVGADFPNAVNTTSADRKENRRVDVKIFTLDMTGSSAQLQSSTQQPTR